MTIGVLGADFSFALSRSFCRGIYDEEFMDYTVEVLKKCKEYGFKVSFLPTVRAELVPTRQRRRAEKLTFFPFVRFLVQVFMDPHQDIVRLHLNVWL